MVKKGDVSESDWGMVVGATQTDWSVYETADLLEFFYTAIFRFYG